MAFLANPIFWVASVLGGSLLGTLGYFLWRQGGKNPQSAGYRKGAKIIEVAPNQWVNDLNNKSQHKPFDEVLKEICNRVFDMGFTLELKHYQAEVEDIDLQMKRVEEEIRIRETSLIAGYKSEMEILKTKAIGQKERVEELDGEHTKTQREEAAKSQGRQEKEIQGPYFSSSLVSSSREKLRISGKNFESDMLQYGYVCIVIILFVIDFSITRSLFNDLFLAGRNSQILSGLSQNFIFSLAFTLVALVLAEFGLESLEGQSPVIQLSKHTKPYFTAGIGILLGMAYLLIVAARLFFPESGPAGMIDLMLAILTAPLIIAAALMIHRIKKEGGFGFILAPFRVAVFGTGVFISYVILPFEAIIKGVYAHYKSKRKIAPIEHSISDVLIREKANLSVLENAIDVLEQKILHSASRLESEILKAISPLREKKEAAIANFIALRRGCDEAVLTQLKKAQSHT